MLVRVDVELWIDGGGANVVHVAIVAIVVGAGAHHKGGELTVGNAVARSQDPSGVQNRTGAKVFVVGLRLQRYHVGELTLVGGCSERSHLRLQRR